MLSEGAPQHRPDQGAADNHPRQVHQPLRLQVRGRPVDPDGDRGGLEPAALHQGWKQWKNIFFFFLNLLDFYLKELEKSLKSKCLTRTYEKTSHTT